MKPFLDTSWPQFYTRFGHLEIGDKIGVWDKFDVNLLHKEQIGWKAMRIYQGFGINLTDLKSRSWCIVWWLDQNASFYLKTPCVPPHLMCYIQQQPIYTQLRVHGYGELASTCMTPASRGYFPRQWTFLGHDLAAARCNSHFYMCAKWLAWRKGRDFFDLLPYYIYPV